MKTIEYVRKYNLESGINFNHNEFVSDLTFDFIALLEVGNSTKNIKGFDNAVRAIRMKWDGIDKKTLGQLPEKLWNFFFATVIAKTRENLFPDIMKQRREDSERRKKQREDYAEFERREFGGGFFWDFLLMSMMIHNRKPIDSFKLLELSDDATVDDVKNSFRRLSMVNHPDKGGDSDKFMEIVGAKNKCLAYLS